ncbi:IclR family transcriptional regulator [Clostridium cellulovorans]|uniref:Glycerol operon regulatory protein n=1 Tax=Clostridium cellulovorans (strain ATCC 35296 / DSM 3052 / OCM 3 / 743B) TaxID=573061 RepID=D9SP37_CLOC7|nr:IclR family transcriptional regulator [Clostridium cellulovorans]ADL52002.1 transcriptional regulator, IclR family [Clostridium cellulovorans 743B]
MQEVVQSVDRALCILEILSDYEDGLGIAEISEKANLHKSTVYRFLNTLIYKGYVTQDTSTSKYLLTLKLFELGNKRIEKMNLVTVAQPYLRELMKKTDEVIHLAVREDNELIYVAKVEPKKSIIMYTRIGMRKPMYCTAMGKAIMAELTEEEVKNIWDTSDRKVYTDNTIVNLSELKNNLREVRSKGYAIDDQEVENGIICMGAVIKDYRSKICGAISVSGTIMSVDEEKKEIIAEELLQCANKISKDLGYNI